MAIDILAVDYGTKRVGLAVAGKIKVASPYKTLEIESDKEKIKELTKIIETEGVEQVVLGLPFATSGEENKYTRKVRNFGRKLSEEAEVPIEYVDERFTSQEADNMGGVASRDEKSAMLILDTYLGQH